MNTNLGLSQPAPTPVASTGGIMELAKKYWWVLLIVVAILKDLASKDCNSTSLFAYQLNFFENKFSLVA